MANAGAMVAQMIDRVAQVFGLAEGGRQILHTYATQVCQGACVALLKLMTFLTRAMLLSMLSGTLQRHFKLEYGVKMC